MARDKLRRRFDRQFDRLERQVPGPLARFIMWLRRPYARLVRIPIGVLLIAGGLLSILPVLGIWMLPLGLLLLAVDLPFLQGPMGLGIIRFRRWWDTWRQRLRRGRNENKD